jgi:hypothetical protein
MSARGEVSTEIINAIADQAELEVPNSMVDREIEDELTQFRSRLAQQRLTLDEYLESNDQTEEDLREEIRPNAARRVRNSLVLQEVAKAENVSVTADDIAAEIERMITPMQNPERMREMYNSDYFRGLLENEMFDRKLTDTVIEIATEGRGAVTGAGAAALAEAFAPAAPAANTDAVAEGATESEALSKSDEGEALPTAQTETTDEPGEVDGSAMAAEAIEAAADSEDDADAASAAGTDDAGAETDAEGETETAAERE